MKEYVATSLETHLFFGRIMREHALFLLAAFPAGEMGYRNKADWFREQFENALEQTVRLADGMVSEEVLCSGEVFTEFTEMAERQTRNLTKIPINIRITQAEKKTARRVQNMSRQQNDTACPSVESECAAIDKWIDYI